MIRVEAITGAELTVADGGWAFALAERRAIMAHWRKITGEKPFLWNGEVFICIAADIRDGVLRARLAHTDFASFVAWRDWGRPDAAAWNCFAAPAVMSSDGALLMGVMGEQTLNGGRTYPPSGSFEPRDVDAGGRVDVRGSMAAELREETGLDLATAEAGAMWAVFEGPRLAVVQRFDLPLTFTAVEAIFTAHRAAEAAPELARVAAIRGRSQIDSTMPGYAQEIVRQFFP